MEHYLRDYWKAQPRQAWDDARHYKFHAWYEVVLIFATVVAAPTVVAAMVHLKHGLITFAISIATIFLWYLLVVTPARIKRDADLRHQADQEKLAEAEARHQADQAAIVGLQSSLEEAETRINGLESSCATERDSTAAARRDVARLAAERGQARVAAAIVVRYSRLRGATAEEQDRLLFGIDNACKILLKDTGDQEVHAACEEIRAVCIMDQPPIEQLEEPAQKLATHYFGAEALPV